MKVNESSPISDYPKFGIGKVIYDHLPIRGKAIVEVHDKNGKLKDRRVISNTITTEGDKIVADQMSDQGEAALSHMAFGTGSGQTSASNALAVETDRTAITSNTQGAGANDNDIIIIDSLTGVTRAVTEAGIFNATPAGDMFCYTDFAVVNIDTDDTLTITWTITFGAS